MIIIFVNEDGYVMTGDSIKSARRCSPALTDHGDRIFQPQHHTYGVLYKALYEVRESGSGHDVIIHNDSRIVDELNGTIEPLDSVCERWLETLNRNVLPRIKGVVFFRKRDTTHLNSIISAGHEEMLGKADPTKRAALAERQAKVQQDQQQKGRKKILQRFKESWLRRQTND